MWFHVKIKLFYDSRPTGLKILLNNFILTWNHGLRTGGLYRSKVLLPFGLGRRCWVLNGVIYTGLHTRHQTSGTEWRIM